MESVSLASLLARARSDNVRYTHLSYYPKAFYSLGPNELNEFWTSYCTERSANLGERITDYAPLRVNLRLCFEKAQEEPYSDNFVLAVIKAFQDTATLFNTEGDLNWFYTLVLQPEDDLVTMEDNSAVAYLSIHFPYFRMTIQHADLLRREAINNLRTSRTISLLTQQPIGDWENIIERPSSTLPLYRSRRTAQEPELVLARIFGRVSQEHVSAGEGPEFQLPEIFVPSGHSLVKRGLLSVDEDKPDHWIPLFLSVDYCERVFIPLELPDEDIHMPEQPELDLAKTFIGMMRPSRFTDNWVEVGKAIYNITQGSDEGLNYWQQLAHRYDRDPNDCLSYSGFNIDNHITIKTLAWYAKQDSPDAYTEWHRGWCYPALEQALEGTHTDVATALYRFYWLDYVCANSRQNTWFRYEGLRWKEDDEGVGLRTLISSDFVREFEKLRTQTSQEIQDSNDANFKRGKEDLLKKITKLIRSLKTQSFKGSLVREAKEFFYNGNFSRILDTDPSILGVFNGVIQLTPTYAIFRPGKPEDFISKYTTVSYQEIPYDCPMLRELNAWLRQMFPTKELLCYAMRLFASCLYGKNSNKIFPILTGAGNNSKSMLKKLFESTFGPYNATVPSSLVTGKRSSSSNASPELAQLTGSRTAFMQEPDGEDSIKSGIVKELTGGDSFFARMLFNNGSAVTASFTLFLMCNKVPFFPNADQAIVNRVRILPFLSTWTKDAPADPEQQKRERKYPMDINFEQKIPSMAPAFLWLLVKEYSSYVKDGLEEPDIVKRHTHQYWEENDTYKLYIHEMMEIAWIPGKEPREIVSEDGEVSYDDSQAERDFNATAAWADVYLDFKTWFQSNNPGQKAPTNSVAKARFIEELGTLRSVGRRASWFAIRIKPTATPSRHSVL